MTADGFVRFAKMFVFDGGLYFALLALAVLLWFRKRKRTARTLAFAVILALGLQCSPLPALWMSKSLYAETASLASESEVRGCSREFGTVVVLGGGLSSVELPDLSSQGRLTAAARYLNSLEDARTIILTGGKTFPKLGIGDMLVYEGYLRQQKISDRHRVIHVGPCRHTRDEAVDVKAMLMELKLPLEIVLVTSAVHMPRAAAVFRRAGFDVCALPAAPYETLQLDVFSFRNAVATRAFLNEALGKIVYRLRGWM